MMHRNMCQRTTQSIVLLAFLIITPHAKAQDSIDFTFESYNTTADLERDFFDYYAPSRYALRLDSNVSHSGSKSLLIDIPNNVESKVSFGFAMPGSILKGQLVQFSTFVKASSKESKQFSLRVWYELATGDHSLIQPLCNEEVKSGDLYQKNGRDKQSNEWFRLSTEIRLPQNAEIVIFEFVFLGRGRVWFDDVCLTLQGIPLREAFAASYPEQGNFQLGKMTFSGSSQDAGYWRALVAREAETKRIIAIGEPNHGTKEVPCLELDVLKGACRKSKNICVIIETSMPDVLSLNDYVLSGSAKMADVLGNLWSPQYKTKEFAECLEWMRQANASGQARIEIWGCDVGSPTKALRQVRSILTKADPDFVSQFNKYYEMVDQHEWLRSPLATYPRILDSVMSDMVEKSRQVGGDAVVAIISHLSTRREAYLKRISSLDFELMVRLSRIAFQSTFGFAYSLRDPYMADNCEWIIRRALPGSTILVFAHNRHISKDANSMGSILSQSFGKEYACFAVTFVRGKFRTIERTAKGDYGSRVLDGGEPYRGSLEFYFRNTSDSFCFVTCGSTSKFPWRSKSIDMRSRGFLPRSLQYYGHNLAQDYDGVFVLRSCSPAKWDGLPDV